MVSHPGRNAKASIDVRLSSLLIFFFSIESNVIDSVTMTSSWMISTIVTTPQRAGYSKSQHNAITSPILANTYSKSA